MKYLNELYDKSCKPKYNTYKKISNNISLIDNFFENFECARDFFIKRDKWKCIKYQIHSKPGYESLFPKWIGRSLMEKYVLDNKIFDDLGSYDIMCNYFYNELTPLWSLSNSNCFPHYDHIENNGIFECICLVNLNKVPVSTKFYSYKNQEYCTNEIKNEWDIYSNSIHKELVKFYNKQNITRHEFEKFMNNEKYSDIKLVKTVKYDKNQAIVYHGNLFHSPNITQEFTEDNPRILLRITFNEKIVKSKNIIYC